MYNDSVEERSGTKIPALLRSAQSPLNHFLRLIWTPETQPALYTAVFHYKTQFVLADEADWSGPRSDLLFCVTDRVKKVELKPSVHLVQTNSGLTLF